MRDKRINRIFLKFEIIKILKKVEFYKKIMLRILHLSTCKLRKNII